MAEKTEQPTPKRIRDSREKGDIAKGQDIAPAATVLAIGGYMFGNAQGIYEDLVLLVSIPMEVMELPYEEALAKAVPAVLDLMIALVAPIVAIVMSTALIVLIAQTGFLFAPKAAMPKLENLSPAKWFKKVFSIKNLVEFLKNLVKVALLGAIAYAVLEKFLPTLFDIPKGGLYAMWSVLGAASGELVLKCAGGFAVIAALDFLYQKYKWTQDHMMSIDEVKREFKESEGDPQVKGKRKQLHQEMIQQGQLSSTRKAKVLVTNPTHFAIALDYEKDKTPLPVILAKGEGALAQRMIQVAKEEGIPIMRNVPLAHALYEQGTENAYIPKDLIGPVAEVLRWVQSLQNQ
ncbi:MAG TPA: EscU/YscU/HrcU family type III secretion system export apparatus switch protein [Sutterella sp.]|nr:EscU/YscU/HrcU family type III secretion system export apparatus switch protein [Sutterella sp.]